MCYAAADSSRLAVFQNWFIASSSGTCPTAESSAYDMTQEDYSRWGLETASNQRSRSLRIPPVFVSLQDLSSIRIPGSWLDWKEAASLVLLPHILCFVLDIDREGLAADLSVGFSYCWYGHLQHQSCQILEVASMTRRQED